MKRKFLLFALVVLAWGGSRAIAQDKMGYIDEVYILEQLPEYKTIKAEMDTYQKNIQGEVKKMEADYKSKEEAYNAAVKANSPQPILESKAKELDELLKQIEALEASAQKEYQGKLAEKLKPVNEKVMKALSDVAVEQGNIYIFRREAMLFVQEENNLSEVILKKLGVTPATPVAGRGNLKSSNKLGYFDQNYVVPQLPEYKKAESELKVFSEMLNKEVEKLQADGRKVYEILMKDQETPTLPEATKKSYMDELQKIQVKIQEQQQSSQTKYQEKYNKLLEPIIKNVQAKLEEVAKENTYTYVFRLEASLYEPKENNISDLVLKKMGITPVTSSNPNVPDK